MVRRHQCAHCQANGTNTANSNEPQLINQELWQFLQNTICGSKILWALFNFEIYVTRRNMGDVAITISGDEIPEDDVLVGAVREALERGTTKITILNGFTVRTDRRLE